MDEQTELDKPMIVNWALAELGLAANFSIDGQTRMGATVDIFWRRAVSHCFSLTDWPFARRTHRLSRHAETPVTGYAYGFELPGGRFGPPVKYLSDPRAQTPIRDTRIEGEDVYCDVPDVWAVCIEEVKPALWDPQFANAFAVALAGYLAVPLLQSVELAEAKLKAAFGSPSEGGAGGMFGRLLAQHRTAGALAAPADTAVLQGGRWHGRY